MLARFRAGEAQGAAQMDICSKGHAWQESGVGGAGGHFLSAPFKPFPRIMYFVLFGIALTDEIKPEGL